MPNKADLAASKLYASIMEEVKIRVLSLNTITNSPNGLPSPLVREYCFLQRRMLCELIALGCLVAHGDIKETKGTKLQKAYKADEILNRLEALHTNFYPSPRMPVFGPKSLLLGDYDADFLTKSELVTLYGRCGDVLHKGSMRHLISPKSPIQTNFPDINKWGQKILNLLSVHIISRIGGDFYLVTFHEAPQVGGNVLVSVAESPKGGAPYGDFQPL
jgi:hypothetical protein